MIIVCSRVWLVVKADLTLVCMTRSPISSLIFVLQLNEEAFVRCLEIAAAYLIFETLHKDCSGCWQEYSVGVGHWQASWDSRVYRVTSADVTRPQGVGYQLISDVTFTAAVWELVNSLRIAMWAVTPCRLFRESIHNSPDAARTTWHKCNDTSVACMGRCHRNVVGLCLIAYNMRSWQRDFQSPCSLDYFVSNKILDHGLNYWGKKTWIRIVSCDRHQICINFSVHKICWRLHQYGAAGQVG